MKQKGLSDLTDEELLGDWKKIKTPYQMAMASLIISIVITIIRTAMYGVGFFIFLPVFITIIAIAIRINYNAVQKEINARNIK
jgi:hypothetical protein